MFCWNCGAKLSLEEKVCKCCGSPTINGTALTPVQDKADGNIMEGHTLAQPETDVGSPEEHTYSQTVGDEGSSQGLAHTQPEYDENSSQGFAPTHTDTGESSEKGLTYVQDEANGNCGTAEAESQKEASATSPPEAEPLAEDLIIRKDRIALSGEKLLLNGRYYLKKGLRFKEKRGQKTIPLSLVTTTSLFQSRCLGKTVASLLLIVIFAVGTVVAGSISFDYKISLDAPYHQERMQELESSLARLNGSAQTDLEAMEQQLSVFQTQLAQTEEDLTDYEIQRNQERLRRAVSSLSFDYRMILSDKFFEKAYDQYIDDLLQAFKNDGLLDSWLYPYYTYSLEQGANRYISEQNNLDMWFYSAPDQRNKYADGMKDADALKESIQDFNLYDRLYYHGRIYITASDFMNTVLYMPNYVADSAVFVKAFGGNPQPDHMSVPGWNAAAYQGFWTEAEHYYVLSRPIWVDYNLSAEDFALDWNQLVDEQAYYDAYIRFMDTVAPGLSTYDMVSYYGSDEAYGGMGFNIIGKEASATEIIALYLQNHPDALEQLDIDLDTIATSLDLTIAEVSGNLESLLSQAQALEKERSELAQFLENGDRLRAEYDELVREKQERSQQLTRAFRVFSVLTGLLGAMTLICLLAFIHFAKMPRHLLTLQLDKGGTVAFSTAFCSKSKLEELEKRIMKKRELENKHTLPNKTTQK